MKHCLHIHSCCSRNYIECLGNAFALTHNLSQETVQWKIIPLSLLRLLLLHITFIGMCIKTFTTMRDNILHQSKFIPKYRYHFDYITQNNYPLTIIKLTLEQSDIPYYIKKIYLMKYRFNCKIIYCKINGHHCVLIFCFLFSRVVFCIAV